MNSEANVADTLERFPLVLCPTCGKTQKMIFVMPGGKNDDDAADIVCDHCKSIIATLHTPATQKASGRPKRAAKARERSEERRVGKECRSRGWREHGKNRGRAEGGTR